MKKNYRIVSLFVKFICFLLIIRQLLNRYLSIQRGLALMGTNPHHSRFQKTKELTINY